MNQMQFQNFNPIIDQNIISNNKEIIRKHLNIIFSYDK